MNESDHEVLQADQQKSEVNGTLPMAEDQHIDESIATDSEKSNSETNAVAAKEIPNAVHTQDELQNRVAFNVTAGNEEEGDNLLHQSKPAKKRGCVQNVRGWFVVVASWIIMIPVAGTLSSFGVLVESLTEEFNATKLESGWIASLAFGFTVGTCPLSTPLITIFGARKLAGFGVISGTASLIATSFAPVIYLMFLTYSAMFGISANFMYNSAMTLTGQYFPSKHQALATCLASAGISFGTLLMNPFSEYLVNEVGWRNTYRILSGMVLVVGLICICAFRPIKTPEQKVATKVKHASPKHRDQVLERALGSNRDLDKHAINESLQNCTESKISLAAQEIKKNVFDKRMYDCSVCSDFSFILWMLGTLFWSVSFLFPLIFLIDYMGTIGIDTQSGAVVMTAYGISEFLGRLLCATVADRLRFGLSYVYAVSGVLMGIANLLAPQGQSLATMYIYAIAIGVNAGILNSLMFATTMQLFGLAKGRHVWGYINVMLALGMVVGPVVAGLIYDATKSYEVAFYVGGCMFMVSAVTMFLLPVARRFCPVKEREAVGKREQEIPLTKKSGGPRNSLRTALFSKEMTKRQLSSTKPIWKPGAANEVRELNELHEELGPV